MSIKAIQKYLEYPTRFAYDPYQWPPDIGLAELHSASSQPGITDQYAIQCPCCSNYTKKTIGSWWNRQIKNDLKKLGAAIPGYFHLLNFYIFSLILVIGVFSVYDIYTIYHTCENFDIDGKICIQVGFLYYLQYNQMIHILTKAQDLQRIRILNILQTIAFYLLLFCNSFSVFFITFFNSSARQQIAENKKSDKSHLLVFHNVPQNAMDNFDSIIGGIDGDNNISFKIIKKMELYEIKIYCQTFEDRNLIYYRILSERLRLKDKSRVVKLNKKLRKLHEKLIEEKGKIGVFNNKIVVVFETIQAKQAIHKIFKLKNIKRWYYGLRTILKQFKILDFEQMKSNPCSFRIIEGSDLFWQNFGEGLGVRMASRIKAFFVCLVFILVCYIILYYPMLFALETHSNQEKQTLTLFLKILPNIISLFLVTLSILFRVYLTKLSGQRNPKDEVQKSRFILITSTIFHTIFFVLMPLLFFILPNSIKYPTVKLYVIAGQARIFIIVQLLLNILDLPYMLWKNRKTKTLSHQIYAFRYNQRMLHEIVQYPEFPLETRADIMLRFWALGILYTFILPFISVFLVIGFIVIYWIEKKNLYRHYSLKRKLSIRLLTEVLTYFINIFSVLLCLIYCLNVQSDELKITIAVVVTCICIVFNIVYWVILNKVNHTHIETEEEMKRKGTNISKLRQTLQQSNNSKNLDQQLTDRNIEEFSDKFVESYQSFLERIQNKELDEEINNYLSLIDEDGEDKQQMKQISIENDSFLEPEKDRRSSVSE